MKTYRVAFCGNNNTGGLEQFYRRILQGRANLEPSDNPDFVFCGIFDQGNSFLKYGDKPIRIYFYTENVVPDFNLFDYAFGFHDLSFGARHLRIPYYYISYPFDHFTKTESCGEMERLLGKNNSKKPVKLAHRKFCNFIYSNSSCGNMAGLRMDFALKLMKYKHVDCPGKVLNNMSFPRTPHGDWVSEKLDFLGNYKFTIAFENSDTPGYTTEKLIHPLLANSVPIYFGNTDVAKDGFNPRAFINGKEFRDLDALAEYVIMLDNNDKEYMKILHQSPLSLKSLPDWDKKVADFIMNIFEHGQKYADTRQPLSPFHVLQRKLSMYQGGFLVKFIALFIPIRKWRRNFRSCFGI